MGLIWDFLPFVLFGVAGMAVSWALLKGLKPRMVLATGMLALALFLVCSFLLDFSSGKRDLAVSLRQSFNQMWKLRSQALQEEKVPQDQIDKEFGEEKDIYEKYFIWCLPGWIAFLCVAIGLSTYYWMASILSRVSAKVSQPIPFRDWVLPDYLVFGLILGGGLKVFAYGDHWVEVVANNLLVFFLGIYALAGLSLFSFFLNRMRFSPLVRILSFLTLFGYLFFYQDVKFTLCAIGVLDVWFNFRKWKMPPLESEP